MNVTEQSAEPQAPHSAGLPLHLAPSDGTMVWLLVDYSREANAARIAESEAEGYLWPWTPLAASEVAWTIGFNNLDNTGAAGWQFVGWCWEQDQFTEGRGEPLAWRPIGFSIEAADHPESRPSPDAPLSAPAKP